MKLERERHVTDLKLMFLFRHERRTLRNLTVTGFDASGDAVPYYGALRSQETSGAFYFPGILYKILQVLSVHPF
jgi:hypothetical protein